jgi:hypothetical protein
VFTGYKPSKKVANGILTRKPDKKKKMYSFRLGLCSGMTHCEASGLVGGLGGGFSIKSRLPKLVN